MEQLLAEIGNGLLVMLGSEQFIGLVVAAVSTVAGILIRRGTKAFELATGMEVEKKHREALHEAVKTSVEAALRHGPDIAFQNLRAHVTTHLHESVPEAFAKLAPGTGVVDRLIERYTAEFLDRALPRPEPK